MPIPQLTPRAVLSAVPLEEIDNAVLSIVSSLGKDARTFEHASAMYNTDFFADESHEFKLALCRSLRSHFAPLQNTFWDKMIKG